MAHSSYTAEEVAHHSTPNDCWIVVEGNVYDVTEYLEWHPGGREMLLAHAGGDASEDFLITGHSERALSLMNHQYRIGELVKGEEERLIILAEDDSQKKKQRRKTSLQRDDGVGEDDNEEANVTPYKSYLWYSYYAFLSVPVAAAIAYLHVRNYLRT